MYDLNSIMNSEITKKTIETIEGYHMLNKHDKVIVGVSGGADSIALLFVLKAISNVYELEIIAIHINHMLRGEEAGRDAAYVESVCSSLGVKCHILNSDVRKVAKDLKISEEEAGRGIRYREFNRYKEKYQADKIVVAHHLNDQAETIIFNMIRGAGLKGLGGINPVRGHIIRPFIEVSRNEIIGFCDVYHLEYMEDSSNMSNKYTRNKIRNELIPFIQDRFNPNVVNQIAHMGKLLQEESEIIGDLIDGYLEELGILEDKQCYRLDKNKLLNYKSAVRKRIYRRAIDTLTHSLRDIESKHIDLIDDMLTKNTGKSINLPNNIVVKISYDYMVISINNVEKKSFLYQVDNFKDDIYIEELSTRINFNIFDYKPELDISRKIYTKWFDYDKMRNGFFVRGRKTGDYINLKGMTGKKKIKHFFIDNRIEASLRDHIPLITNGNEVIWVVGYRINKNYMVTENTKKILEINVLKEDKNEI